MKTALLASLISIASLTSLSTHANPDYNYISGGYQLSVFDEYYFDNHDYMTGYYARGSWNFSDNLFVELRRDSTSRDRFTLNQSLLGLGYFHPITDKVSIYGLIGFDALEAKYDINGPLLKADTHLGIEDTAFTGEMGAKIDLFDVWQIEPAIRVATFNENLYELRLGNTFSVTDNLKLELNFTHRAIELSDTRRIELPDLEYDGVELHDIESMELPVIREMNYQVGLRYAF